MRSLCSFLPVGVAVLAIAIPPCAGAAAAQGASETVEGLHPGLASGVLTFGRLAQLPKDVLLRAGPVALTRADLAKILAGTPDAAQDELERNAFFLLENEATPRLLALAAKAELSADEKKSERQLIEDYLERVTAKVRVGDEEVARFYEENRELLGGAALDAVKQPIRQHLLEGKRQQVVAEHLRTLGQRLKIEVAAAWVEEQAIPAMDNPVDKARRSGKPSLVVFGGACG